MRAGSSLHSTSGLNYGYLTDLDGDLERILTICDLSSKLSQVLLCRHDMNLEEARTEASPETWNKKHPKPLSFAVTFSLKIPMLI